MGFRFAFVRQSGLLVLLCTVLFGAAAGQNVEVLKTDFEKGTQKWEKRGSGSVSIRSTKKESATGKKSLRVSGRKENWQGAQLNITKLLEQGKRYRFTASVKLAKDQDPDQIKMTMQRGDNQFDGVASTEANAGEWKTISGQYILKTADPYLLIYLEANGPRTSFFIDDFKIELLGAPEQKGTVLKTDFQNASAQNWLVRGDNVKMYSAAVGGDIFLRVGGRSQSWHGLALDVSSKVYKERTYSMSIRVKIVEASLPDKISMKVMRTGPDGMPKFVEVASEDRVGDSSWVTLKGNYQVIEDGFSHVVVIEAAQSSTSFYVDDFELSVP
ncbi:MAG: hypothetical protein HKN33_07230 [Pyrinomonadaceae bacterium]|nr:hypothetical protein [Pyrinomonadaceae bacterium]